MPRILHFSLATLFVVGMTAAPALARSHAGGDLALGKRVYQTNCATCHGMTGEGNGPASAALRPKPRNFVRENFKFGGTVPAVMHTIAHGIQGSAMPAWQGTLSPAKIHAVAQYVIAIHEHKVK